MTDLSVPFMGIQFQTPFLLASGQATTAVGQISRHCREIAENHWGGLVTKTIIARYGVYKRPHLWSSRRLQFLAMTNTGPAMTIFSKKLMKALKKDVQDAHCAGLVIIPSIIGNSLEEWRRLAREVEDTGADALELNLSCPSPSESIKKSLGGYLVGQNVEVTRQVVEVVAKAVRIPVMPKLTFHSPDIAQSARVCKEAGAKAVSAINTIRGILGVDLDTGKILSEGANGKTYLGGISGPLIKPFGLRSVAEIKMEVKGLEVCAIGGIDGWESVVEYLMVGAGLVQVCTGVMWYGFSLGKKLRNGLARYMQEKNFRSLSDFQGMALKDIDSSQSQESVRAYPVIDEEKCNLCRRCLRACGDAAYHALSMEGSKMKISSEKCEGCGLCRVVCKEEAISQGP